MAPPLASPGSIRVRGAALVFARRGVISAAAAVLFVFVSARQRNMRGQATAHVCALCAPAHAVHGAASAAAALAAAALAAARLVRLVRLAPRAPRASFLSMPFPFRVLLGMSAWCELRKVCVTLVCAPLPSNVNAEKRTPRACATNVRTPEHLCIGGYSSTRVLEYHG